MYDPNSKTNKECVELLKAIFMEADSFYHALAPDGWKESEYVKLLHPTAEQKYEEHIRVSENIRQLSKKPRSHDEPEKKVNDFSQDDLMQINEMEELMYVLGLAVYDIFSNNHEVIGSDTKIYDLGSMRGSGRFIAEFINMYRPQTISLDYTDFYMGSTLISSRADMYPFYCQVFKTLKENRCDWKYSFPRLHLVDLRGLKPKDDDPESYKPEQALEDQLQKDKEVNEWKEKLDKIYEEELEEAKYKPLPAIIRAYKNIYGVLPDGHPQKEFE